MYIMINRERMVFMHKHPKYQVLGDLAWIECDTAHIFPLGGIEKFKEFTDVELSTLYHKTTGEVHPGLTRRNLQLRLAEIADGLACSDVRDFEVGNCAALVEDALNGKMKYVKGQMRPAKERSSAAITTSTPHPKAEPVATMPLPAAVPANPWAKASAPTASAPTPWTQPKGTVVTQFGVKK